MARSSTESLQWEGVSLADLAESLGTPVFVFSESRLRANCAMFREALSQASVRYCVKTNNELALLRVIAEEGFGALVSHAGEVDLAMAAGFASEALAFQRPVLDETELSRIAEVGIRRIHVHRPEDVALLAANGAQLEVIIRVSMRTRTPLLKGSATRLGCSDAEVRAAADAIGKAKSLRLGGLSVYVGTQQTDAQTFRAALANVVRLARGIRGDGALEINIGGGIPAAETRKISAATIWKRWFGSEGRASEPRKILDAIAAEWEQVTAGDRGLHLVIEPGRSLVADAGVLLTRVAAVQRGWIFVDASRNYFGEMPVLFTRPLKPVRPRRGERRMYSISGSTLNTADIIDLRRSFEGPLEVGDVLASFDAGAYSISRASRYAGLSPAVYMLGPGGKARLIRRAESSSDLAAAMEPTAQ